MSEPIDITGQKFGRWTVLGPNRRGYWDTRCACGFETRVLKYALRHNLSRGCRSCVAKDKEVQLGALKYHYQRARKVERNDQLYADRLSGLTFKALGLKYGITTVRARQIFEKHRRQHEIPRQIQDG